MTTSSPSSDETVVYVNDFNGPVGSTYPEWSAASYSWTANQAGTIAAGSGTETITNVDSYNSSQRFLGELGGPVILKAPPYDRQHFVRVDEAIALSLVGLQAHSALALTFDLYILKSWDGNNPIYGPDRWSVAISGGPTLLTTTFSNNVKTGSDLSFQDFPSTNSAPQAGAFQTNLLGYGFWFGDAAYHMSFTFPHTGSAVSNRSVYGTPRRQSARQPAEGSGEPQKFRGRSLPAHEACCFVCTPSSLIGRDLRVRTQRASTVNDAVRRV